MLNVANELTMISVVVLNVILLSVAEPLFGVFVTDSHLHPSLIFAGLHSKGRL